MWEKSNFKVLLHTEKLHFTLYDINTTLPIITQKTTQASPATIPHSLSTRTNTASVCPLLTTLEHLLTTRPQLQYH